MKENTSMELQVSEVKQELTVKNYDDLKKELEVRLKPYTETVVTEESLSNAKEDIAYLNKVAKAINDEKIKVVRDLTSNFEAQCKDLTSMIKGAVDTIKEQTNKFELERQEKKRLEVSNLFDTLNTEGYIKVHQIWNEKWLNKGYKIKDIEKEIVAELDKVKTDLDTIEKLNYTDEQKKHIKYSYLVCLDLNQCIKQEDEAIENYKRYVESQNKALDNEKDNSSAILPQAPQTSVETPKTGEKQYTCVIQLSSNVDNLIEMLTFLKANAQVDVEKYTCDIRLKTTRQSLFKIADFLKANEIKNETVEKSHSIKEEQ